MKYVRPEQEGLLHKYVMKWNPLKWNIEVYLFAQRRCLGSSLMNSPLFVCLNVNIPIVDSKREMDQRRYDKERTCDAKGLIPNRRHVP